MAKEELNRNRIIGLTLKSKNEKLKLEWENKAKIYNSIFDYLESKGLKQNDLIEFSELLNTYIELAIN